MAERVTVMIDEENVNKLRTLYVKTKKESPSSVSFSRVINETLQKGLDLC